MTFDESKHNRDADGKFTPKPHAEGVDVSLEASTPIRHLLRGGGEMWKLPDGTLHRDEGPAIVQPDGTQAWFRHGLLHRDDGGPARTLPVKGGRGQALREWYENGLLHRDGGPAVTQGAFQAWYRDGKKHREGGPAVTYTDGREEWWINGKQQAPPAN